MASIINGRGSVGIRRSTVISQSTIVTDGLKLYLDAGNASSYPGTGTVWNDISGNGNNGTLINGPTYSSANNGSIVFDGVNDYANTSNNINISGADSRTLECWIFLTSNQTKNIMGFGDNENLKLFDTILWFTGGFQRVVGHYYGPGDTLSTLPSRNTININAWNQVVHTYNGATSTASIWTNGVLSNSVNVTINTTNTTFSVGSGNFTAYNSFNGRISNTKIYNRALSATEILQNYNALKSRYGL